MQARTAKIARSLLDRDVDRPEACDSRHQHIRIQRQQKNDRDPRQPVNGANRNAHAAQARGHDAGMTEEQHQRVSGNERWQHQRQRGQRQQHGLARHVDTGQAERQWRADQRGAHRREGRREQAVGDAVQVILARENLGIVREREGPGPVHPETRIQNQAERIKQEQHEKGERAENHGVAESFHCPG